MGDNSLVKALALATQLGFAVAGPLVVFIGGGVWLDGKLHTAPLFFLLGLALGLVSAGGALYQIAVVGGSKGRSTTTSRTRRPVDLSGENDDKDDAGTNPANDQRLKRP